MSAVIAYGIRRRVVPREEVRDKADYDRMAKRNMIPLEITKKITMWINERDVARIYRQGDLFHES